MTHGAAEHSLSAASTLAPMSFQCIVIAHQWLHHDLRRRCCRCLALAGVRQLLQYPSLPDNAQHFAAVEGLSCQTGLLDGPASLTTSLLACGSTSDASLAAFQAGQSALCNVTTIYWHEQAHLHGSIWAITILRLLTQTGLGHCSHPCTVQLTVSTHFYSDTPSCLCSTHCQYDPLHLQG